MTLKSGKKCGNYSNLPRRFYRSRDRCSSKKFNKIADSIPLNISEFNRSRNYTLDFTSANSTPSDRTFDITHKASTTDTVTERKIDQKLTKEKFFSKMSTMKPQSIFCNDPNKRLKNLFTIVKPIDKLNENGNIPKNNDIVLLNNTKELLVKLIDGELHRIQSDGKTTENVKPHLVNVIDNSDVKKLKFECLRKIEDEIRLMKRLENL